MSIVTADSTAGTSITDANSIYGPGGAQNFNRINVPGDDGKPNPYPYGECTWYVWQFYHDTQQVDIPATLGNATDWVTSAHREQWSVDADPVAGKAVSWGSSKYPPFGHVAVVKQVNGDGSFDVLEANFTYYASDDPRLAGKIDQRTVKDRDGIQGFITPNHVQVSNGQQDSPWTALAAPLTSIGDAIKHAALFIEAEAMTAELKAQSLGQVALGTVIGGGGAALAGFTLAGSGNPRTGFRRARRTFRRRTRQMVTPQRPRTPARTYKPAEQQWLSRQSREDMIGQRAQAKLAAGYDPRKLTDAEAAWLQQHPELVREALIRQRR